MERASARVFLTFLATMIFIMSGCASGMTQDVIEPVRTSTSVPTEIPEPTTAAEPSSLPEQPQIVEQLTVSDAEKLAGFDIQEPTYLPTGVYLDFVTYETTLHPKVILKFNLNHEQFGDVGQFFLITQEPKSESSTDSNTCGHDCETLQAGDITINYRLNRSTENPGADTELLTWDSNGFSFSLLRTSGEPNKIYKDELLKVVGSMN